MPSDDRYRNFLRNFGHPVQDDGLPRSEGVRETWRTVAFYAVVVALMIGALFVIEWVRG